MASPIIHLPFEWQYLQGKVLSSRVYPEFFSLTKTGRVLNVGFGDGPQAVVYRDTFSSMLGIDVNEERLARARRMLDALGVFGVTLQQGNVENIAEPDHSFGRILAIDIFEHVEHPAVFLKELHRLLARDGEMLITYPAMHDRFTDATGWLGHKLGRHGKHEHPAHWHPDHHQEERWPREWEKMLRDAGFVIVATRATTLFPPLHLYGIPRFWFKNRWIHAVDRRLAALPVLKYLGQTLMARVKLA